MLTRDGFRNTDREHALEPTTRRSSPTLRRLIGVGLGWALLLALSACTADVTAAAVVGNTPISSSEVDARTGLVVAQAGQSSQNSTLIDLGRQELNAQIRHQLLVDLGLFHERDQASLLALAQQLGGTQQVAQQLGAANLDELLSRLNDLGSQIDLLSAAASEGELVSTPSMTFDYVKAPSYADAVDLKARYAKEPAQLTADAQVAARTQSGGVGLTITPITDGAFVPSGVFNAAPGQVLVFAIGNTNLVLLITDAQVVSEPLDVTTLEKAGVPGILGASGLLLAARMGKSQVQVNPRYGVWDSGLMQVTSEPGRR